MSSVFIVRLEHPDEQGWHRWVEPHVEWVNGLVGKGAIIASGPSVGTPVRQGWLIMRAEDEHALRELLATDPFWINGIVENLLITEWNPVFGRLTEFASALSH